jgi:hypothetical protein
VRRRTVLLVASVALATLAGERAARAGGRDYGVDNYRPGIVVEGPASFRREIEDALATISQNGFTGLLDSITSTGQTVTIGPTVFDDFTHVPEVSQPLATFDGVVVPGVPSSSYIAINTEQLGDDEGETCLGLDTVLVHELNHALDAANGTFDASPVSDQFPFTNDGDNTNFTSRAEENAVGVGPYADNPYSEDAYRDRVGLPHRDDYATVCPRPDPDAVGNGDPSSDTPDYLPPDYTRPSPDDGSTPSPVSPDDPAPDPESSSPIDTAASTSFGDFGDFGDEEGGGGGGGGFALPGEHTFSTE